MTRRTVRTVRQALAAGAVVGIAAVGAMLPSAAIAADATRTLSPVDSSARASGAAMLGGWVGGGVLLLGTGVFIASATVRRSTQDEEAVLAEA